MLAGPKALEQCARGPQVLRPCSCTAAHSSTRPATGLVRGRRSVAARAGGDDAALRAFANLQGPSLDAAARRFATGVQAEIDEDELVAMELGAGDSKNLTDVQKKYAGKVKEKLAQRAAELQEAEARAKAAMSRSLEQGKKAYEYGEYAASVKLLTKAVEELSPNSALGGEAQLWLALAFQECVDLYKSIEANHPMPKIKKQAAALRYIIEAPKMPLTKEERVEIPLLQTDASWSPKKRKSKPPQKAAARSGPPPKKTYWDSVDWSLTGMPAQLPDKWYVKVAAAIVAVATIVYVNSVLVQSGQP